MSDFLRFHGPQHPGLLVSTISWSSLKFLSIGSVMLSSHLILCRPLLLLLLQSFPASGSFPMSQLFASGGQSIGASASASVLPMNIQDWLPLGLAALISWSPRDSRESTPAPQLESINSLALSPYGPTFILARDYWKSNSFDYTDLYWPCCLFCYNFTLSDLAHGSDHTLINVESLCGRCSRIRPQLPGKKSPGLALPRPHLIVQCIPHR